MQDIQISAVYFFIIKEYIQKNEHKYLFSEELWEKIEEISSQGFLNKFSLLTFNRYIKILLEAQVSDQLFIDIAEYFEIKHYGLVGYISSHAKNFNEAGLYIEKFCPLIIDRENLESIQFIHENQTANLQWPLWNHDSIWINEINLAAIYKIIQQLLNTQLAQDIDSIQIAHSPLMDIEKYQNFYQSPIVFNATNYAFVFNQNFLNTPLPTQDEVLLALLLKQAEEVLVQSESKVANLTNKLSFLIKKYLEMGEPIPEIDVFAHSLHMSKRTFQRKLKDQNINWRQLSEQQRMSSCKHLLIQKQLSLTEIALQLGY